MSEDRRKIIDDFDKRLLERIDQQFMNIEAISSYDIVKRERDELKNDVEDLKGKLSEESNTISKCKVNIEKLEQENQQIRETEEKTARANHQLKAKVEELESLEINVFEENSPTSDKVDDARNISGGGGHEENVIVDGASSPLSHPRTINLFEAQRRFLKSKKEKIERRADELFNSMKQEWERKEKPKLVSDAAAESLRQVVEQIVNQRMQAIAGKPPLPSSITPPLTSSPDQQQPPSLPLVPERELYSMVNSIIESGVAQKLNNEFETRVEAESQRRTVEKVAQLANIEWPHYYSQNILPLADQLEQMMMDNVFNFLTGPWSMTCKICGTLYRSRMLSPEEVETLINSRTLEFQCYGTYLRSQVNLLDIISGVAHSFKISLLELIEGELIPEQEENEND